MKRRRLLFELCAKGVYLTMLSVLYPASLVLALFRRDDFVRDSVLHVSYMVHVPWHATRILRRHGWKADYVAVGTSAVWDRSDYRLPAAWTFRLAWDEFRFFWRVVARYQAVHLHFMITTTVIGWEIPVLKVLGRKVIAHFRGCEARNRELNRRLHPDMNICEQCDYNATLCTSRINARRRRMARRHADATLVTTPDMLDFMPHASHFPFFAPEVDPVDVPGGRDGALQVVHATNHPGIEGTALIEAAIGRLRAKGHRIDFRFLRGVSHDEVLSAMRGADIVIGKMKMGYYANAQIESMALGIPTITYVRPEFMTQQLRDSGFIFCHPRDLEATLERLIRHPEELAAKRRIARESILRLHDNAALAARLIHVYRNA